MSVYKNDQNKITLAAIFIATYLTVFFGFYDKFNLIDTSQIELFKGLGYMMLLVFSGIIAIIFFIYLVFTALGLTSNKNKEVILDQEISDIKIEKTKNFLFNTGVKFIFLSFTYPIYYLMVIFIPAWGIWVAVILWGICLMLIYILLYILFKND